MSKTTARCGGSAPWVRASAVRCLRSLAPVRGWPASMDAAAGRWSRFGGSPPSNASGCKDSPMTGPPSTPAASGYRTPRATGSWATRPPCQSWPGSPRGCRQPTTPPALGGPPARNGHPARPTCRGRRACVADEQRWLSVWPTSQQPAPRQRAGRYLPESTAHPAKMLPAIAQTSITRYTKPGELVLDPMCGIGTTLVEAAWLCRTGFVVEYERRWAELARANLDHATSQGAGGTGTVITGDARHLLDLVPDDVRGHVALVLTSPPYGPSVHGQADARPGRGVAKWDYRYSEDPANLGRANERVLLGAMEQILAACRVLLRPGGVVMLTARPWRRRGLLVDFPGALGRAGERAGLVPFERNVALLVGLNGDRL